MQECTKPGPSGKYARIAGMDSRADWLLDHGSEDFLPDGEQTMIPFIMALHDQAGLNAFEELLTKPPFFVPSVYTKNLKVGDYFTGFARKAFFDDLAGRGGTYGVLRDAVKEIQLCAPLKSPCLLGWEPGQQIPALANPPIEPPEGGWPPGTVVVGIIDDGIAFAHERFRNADGTTRVECFWRQDGPHDPTSPTVEFGSEICKRDHGGKPGIDRLLRESTVGGSVDEETLYRRAGLIDFAEPGGKHKAAAWRAAHGTHVLDLAAGADPAENVDNRPIVGVQLPTSVVEDTSGAGLEDKLLRGIRYILDRADAMSGDGDPLPVVINFSWGTIAGPHDGTSSLELGLDREIVRQRKRPLRIVLPSGNSHLSRCHAAVKFPPEVDPDAGLVELCWRVQPDDKTPSFLEIWLPHQGARPPGSDRIRLSITTPDGVSTALLGETHGTDVTVRNNGEVICQAAYSFNPPPKARGLFHVCLQPSARLQPASPPLDDKIAPSGLWKVKLHNVSLGPTDVVHAWIHRDDTVFGYPRRGRQSYFDDPCYKRFDSQGREIEQDDHPEQPPCHVKRDGLINALATGQQTIVIGGYQRSELRFAKYSAGGPITPPAGSSAAHRDGPDAVAVSDDSEVHFGVLAAGSHSGSVVAINGTSVAAPQIARCVADELASGRPGDRPAVCAMAAAPMPPRKRGGCGRIERPPMVPRRLY